MIKIETMRNSDMLTLKRRVEEWARKNKDIEIISVSHDREHATSFTAWITYKEIQKEIEVKKQKKKLNIEGE